MKTFNSITVTLAALLSAVAANAQTGNIYLQTNLVSNIKGLAPVTDPNLVDPWGDLVQRHQPVLGF